FVVGSGMAAVAAPAGGALYDAFHSSRSAPSTAPSRLASPSWCVAPIVLPLPRCHCRKAAPSPAPSALKSADVTGVAVKATIVLPLLPSPLSTTPMSDQSPLASCGPSVRPSIFWPNEASIGPDQRSVLLTGINVWPLSPPLNGATLTSVAPSA